MEGDVKSGNRLRLEKQIRMRLGESFKERGLNSESNIKMVKHFKH